MRDALLFLHSEWQGCESPILAEGSIKLAKELFGTRPFAEGDTTISENLEKRNGVFALNTIGSQFIETLKLLENVNPKQIMTVGGSCGTEVAPVSYLNSLYEGDLAVVWFDAHGDLNTPDSSPSGHFHGMVLRTLMGEGPEIFCSKIERPLDSGQVFLAGTRDLDESEMEYIESSDITICEVNKNIGSQFLVSSFKNVYIHIDVDVINPDDFSDALMPTKNGPTRKHMSKCLSAIQAKFNIVGVGVTEYCGRQQGSSKQISVMLEEGGITSPSN